MNNNRNSNIEILRIIAMLMIIAHHYCFHGVLYHVYFTPPSLISDINKMLINFISIGGKLGVDIFIIITGYFMIKSSFKLGHFIRIYLTTLIYSLLFLIIAYIYGCHQVPSKLLNVSIFPFGRNAYWFISTYLMLYLLTPYLNKFILTAKKSLLNSFMFTTSCLWMIIPTFTNLEYCLSNLAWFIFMYFIGASIRIKKYASIFSNKRLFKKLFILSCTIFIVITISLPKIGRIANMQSLLIVSIAVYLFHYFNDLNINFNKIINYISASVFGIYLFHDNNIVRAFLWNVIVHPYTMLDKYYMIMHLLISVFVIFIFGVLIDKLMNFLFERPINNICDFVQKRKMFIYRRLLKITHKIANY